MKSSALKVEEPVPAVQPLERIRLYKLVTMFGVGGTERQVANLVRRLDVSRFDLRMGCLKRYGYFLNEIERRRIPISEFRLTSLRNFGTLRQEFRLAGELRRNRTQVLHSYNFYANVFGIPAARAAGVPVVIASVRDLGVYLTPTQQRVQHMVLRFADRVLVNAEAIRDWLVANGLPAEKVGVIHNGIDTDGFAVRGRAPGLRRELGLPAGAPLVVMVSRLNRQKGIEDFIEAAAEVGRRCPEACFLVVGEAYVRGNGGTEPDLEYRRHLAQMAQALGLDERLRFTGARADIAEVLSETAVSVLPSYSEGLSNTLLESMAAGVPVVATDVGGNPEVLRSGGGILVPVRNPGKLADAVASILSDAELAKRLAVEARRSVVQRFSLERMVRSTQDVYEQLVETKTGATS